MELIFLIMLIILIMLFAVLIVMFSGVSDDIKILDEKIFKICKQIEEIERENK